MDTSLKFKKKKKAQEINPKMFSKKKKSIKKKSICPDKIKEKKEKKRSQHISRERKI